LTHKPSAQSADVTQRARHLVNAQTSPVAQSLLSEQGGGGDEALFEPLHAGMASAPATTTLKSHLAPARKGLANSRWPGDNVASERRIRFFMRGAQ